MTKTEVTIIDAHLIAISFFNGYFEFLYTNNSSPEKDENVIIFFKSVLNFYPGNIENIAFALKIIVDFSILTPQMQIAVITTIIVAASGIAQLVIPQHPLVEAFLRLK